MAFIYRFSAQERKIFVTTDGDIDFRSAVELFEAVSTHPDFQPDYQAVIDLRGIKYKPSTHEIFRFRDNLASYRHKFKGEITLLLSESDLHRGRIFRVLAKAYDLDVTISTRGE
jgi:hypothetical protein